MDELGPLIEHTAFFLIILFPALFLAIVIQSVEFHYKNVIKAKNFVQSLGECIEAGKYMLATRLCNKTRDYSPLADWAKRVIVERDDPESADKVIEDVLDEFKGVNKSLKLMDLAAIGMTIFSLVAFGTILMFGGRDISWVSFGVAAVLIIDFGLLILFFVIRGKIETFFEEAPDHLRAVRTFIEAHER